MCQLERWSVFIGRFWNSFWERQAAEGGVVKRRLIDSVEMATLRIHGGLACWLGVVAKVRDLAEIGRAI